MTTVVTFKLNYGCTSLWPCIFMFGDHLDLLFNFLLAASDGTRASGASLSCIKEIYVF